MLARIVRLQTAITSVLSRANNAKHKSKLLSVEEFLKVSKLVQVLEPFYKVTVQLSASNYASCSMILPARFYLEKKVTNKKLKLLLDRVNLETNR